MKPTRDNKGRILWAVSDDEILEAIRKGDGTTKDVAEQTGLSQHWARRRIKELYNNGRIDRRKIGITYIYKVIES